MKGKAGGILAVGVISILLTAVECSAQFVSSFEQLQVLVKPGDNIYVTDTAGVTTKGRIEELSSSSLGLVVKGKRRDLTQTDVREIRQWRSDSARNGAMIGAASVGGLIAVLWISAGGCDCGSQVRHRGSNRLSGNRRGGWSGFRCVDSEEADHLPQSESQCGEVSNSADIESFR